MSGRGVPFHCPYCGDEDLRPHETEEGAGHGAWECRSCLRAFSLKMLGLINAQPSGPVTSEGTQRRRPHREIDMALLDTGYHFAQQDEAHAWATGLRRQETSDRLIAPEGRPNP